MKGIRAYQVTVFVSAFLLFQVQPMMSKGLLPWFGGSYLVWGAALVFFQGMLLLGYLFAHSAQQWLGVRRYARWHWLALLLSFVCLPFSLRPVAEGAVAMPLVVAVFRHLLPRVGLPVLALAMTSLVLQRWLSVSALEERRNPYVLYGASNLGSMMGLLSYPLVVEPLLDLRVQCWLWWAGFVLLVGLHVPCFLGRKNEEDRSAPLETGSRAGPNRLPLWLVLSAAGSAALLATTNALTFDLAPVPLLWVLPLGVFLLTYVLSFKKAPWYPAWIRRAFLWAVVVGVVLFLMGQLRCTLPIGLSLALQLGILFVLCLNCHGALYAARPADPRELTRFYLALAAGGLVGSVAVSWVMPRVSTILMEVPGALFLAALGMAMTRGVDPSQPRRRTARTSLLSVETGVLVVLTGATFVLLPWLLKSCAGVARRETLLVAIAVPGAVLLVQARRNAWRLAAVLLALTLCFTWTEGLAVGADNVERLRNYYGIYRVYDAEGERFLQHGTTLHGREALDGPDVGVSLSYFHPTTPAAGVLMSGAFRFRDIGMIGLGTGALAGYVGDGQTFTIFELDPDNLPIAEQHFSYLRRARDRGAELDFVFGDGRVSLKKAPAASFDLLIIDAFSSGSIPVHLLTVEAIEEYFRTIRPGGFLLMHVSNRFIDLVPVVAGIAHATGRTALSKTNAGRVAHGADETVWAAVADPRTAQALSEGLGWTVCVADQTPPWTDRYSNLLRALFH